MASTLDVIEAIGKFQLDLIEKQWADEIWANDFTVDPDDISEEFADRFSNLSYFDIVQVIEQAEKIINLWLKNQLHESHSGPSWTSLQAVDYRKLLGVLFFYISKGHLNNQNIVSVNACIKATNFYFTLLSIPGSDVFKIFNVALFGKALETFSLHKCLEIATGKKIKKKKAGNKNDGMDVDEEFYEMDETLTFAQQQQIVKVLDDLLTSFQHLIRNFSLKKYPEALSNCLSVLAELTRVEKSLQGSSTNSPSLATISKKAFMTLKGFCSDMHGRTSEIIRLVLFYLMPNLTFVGGTSNPDLNSIGQKELTVIRNCTVAFIISHIMPMGKESYPGLKIMIQQFCFNMIDRADYRSRATDMIVTLLTKVPAEFYYIIVKWLFRLSMTEGAHHRVVSLELLAKLIFLRRGCPDLSSKTSESQSQLSASQLQNTTISKNELSQKSEASCTASLSTEPVVSFYKPSHQIALEYRKVMLAIIIDRIRDESTHVKSKALTLLSELLGSTSSKTLREILKDVFVKPYSNLDVIDLKSYKQEKDFVAWKACLSLLEVVQEGKTAENMLPGGRVIVKKVFDKCLDVRASVRRAALQVVSSLFKFSSKWMTSETLQLFGQHSRDPALSIRKDMLHSLTDLMLYFPRHEPLIKLWVEEVVPIIMDREIRVQQHALQIFTNTILSKINPFSTIKSPSDHLPWKLLNKIAEQNKRQFLLTACALWSENGRLNDLLIKTLQSHIGTVNNAPAWVFLSCISEYFDIKEPDFVMSYYMDVVSKETESLHTSYLALYTLSTSWENLPKEMKEILQLEMFNKLKSFTVCPTFVELIVEITAGLTVYLAEDELTGKKEVAKWGIEMIKDCEKHLEDCLKPAHESETGCKNCINILGLLGALTGLCPNKINHPTFLLLYNFLMKTKELNTSFDKKMRAMTVVTLSKMSLQCDVFARSLVAGLAQLLSQSDDPVLLNNVIVAIADIGESYANLIEPLIPFICVCLKSKHKRLKEITLILLIELLQEDYLKARGSVIFHLLTMVNEHDPWLVNIVKFYFTSTLLPRNPYKMYQLFLPGLFHFNNYTNHPDYPRVEMMDAEFRAFDLSGPENHKKRMNIYNFMLTNIPEMVKMKCLHFICTGVLNGVADNLICIKNKNGEQLLYDALCVLLTPEIKIEFNELVKKKNDDEEEDEEEKQNPLYKLGKQMFTAAQKKEIFEIIIPICCKLKKKLVTENKKLLPFLHKFVRELVKDYKSDINEIFKEDKQFGVEILHELEKISNAEDEDEEDLTPQEFLCSSRNDEDNNRTIHDDRMQLKEAVVSLERLNFAKVQNILNRESVLVSSSAVRAEQGSLPEQNLQNGESEQENLNEAVKRLKEMSESRKREEPIPVQRMSVIRRIPTIEEVGNDGMETVETNEQNTPGQDMQVPLVCIPVTNLLAPLKPLSPERVQVLERGAGVIVDATRNRGLKNEEVAENRMETSFGMQKSMDEIIMPPPVKVILYKKNSMGFGKGKTPTTPTVIKKNELMTSTPTVQAERSEFEMDLSPVMDEEE